MVYISIDAIDYLFMNNKQKPCCLVERREYLIVKVKLNALMRTLHWRERTIFCTYELTHSRSGNGQSDNSHIKENKAIEIFEGQYDDLLSHCLYSKLSLFCALHGKKKKEYNAPNCT